MRQFVFGGVLTLLSFLVATGQVPPGDTEGSPWTGSPGVTESAEQIMTRDQKLPPTASARAREVRPRFFLPEHEPKPKKGEEGGDEGEGRVFLPPGKQLHPKPDTSVPPSFPQIVGRNFFGAQLSESGAIPPDSMGAVGITNVVVFVNGRIKNFNRNGAQQGLNTTTDNFFDSVRTPGSGTSDPHIRFDRLTRRWFVTMIDTASPNRVLIAVSRNQGFGGTGSGFTFFQFQQDLVGPTPNADTGHFADYDTLGEDANALYIGVNMFDRPETPAVFLGTTGFVINKSNLLAGILTVTAFRQLSTSGDAGPYTPQGVDNDDPQSTEGYFIGVNRRDRDALVLRRISNPGGVPSISANLPIPVPAFTSPISQAHKGDTLHVKLDAIDNRLFAAHIKKNKLTGVSSLWTAHHLQVDADGNPQSGGTGGRNGSRWYEVRDLTTTPTLYQSGTLFDSAVTNARGFWFPSVAGTGQGHMALGCSFAGSNDFVGVAVSGRLASDPPGLTQSPTFALLSTAAYNLGEGNTNRHRWGDYSQTVVDPTDDMTMWTFQEYCNSADSWAVRAIQLRAPLPATPVSASPAVLVQGQSSVIVNLTGESVTNSAFFDPGPDVGGPGFLSHIAAFIPGGGITVQKVTFKNPTNLVLDLSVAVSAALGARTIRVTNPDGQTAISAPGVLTVIAPPAISVSDVALFEGQSGFTNATFTVSLSAASPQTVIVNYATTNGTATDGSDYVSASGTLTFPPGVTSSNVTVTVKGDTDAEANETFFLDLSGATNATLATVRATGTILDDDSPPVADFAAGPTEGVAPLTVNFTNQSTSATSLLWDFGDGNTGTANQPANTYTAAGTYSVTLTAVGPVGTNVLTRTNYIVVTNPPPPVADFVAGPIEGDAPLTVNFTNLSTTATSFLWDFGDGNTSASGQPVNTYSNGGTYSVTLTAINLIGTNALTRTNYIVVTITPPILTVGLTNDAVILTWLSVSARTNWLEYKDDLSGTNWIILTNVLGTGNLQNLADGPTSLQSQRFYRVRVE